MVRVSFKLRPFGFILGMRTFRISLPLMGNTKQGVTIVAELATKILTPMEFFPRGQGYSLARHTPHNIRT